MTKLASRMKQTRRRKTMTALADDRRVSDQAADNAHRAYRDELARAFLSVGTTPKDRATWLLRFGTDGLDSSSVDRVAAEVDAFISQALDSPDSPISLNAVVFTPGVAEVVHREWKAALGALRNNGAALSPGAIRFGLHWDRRGGAVALGAGQSDTLGVFFLLAFQVLTRTGLRACERARCGRFFVPTRADQRYCGKACRDAEAQVRLRRERPEEASERRHKKYARTVKAGTPKRRKKGGQ